MELTQTVPGNIQLLALSHKNLDITAEKHVRDLFRREKPDWVINAAAYTAVDKAEEDRDMAFLVNRDGASSIARGCKEVGAKMVQISTDYVFNGQRSQPYKTDAEVNPLNVYGASKLAGEESVLDELSDQCIILRSSWIYSAYGNNFVKTMLKLMQQRPQLNIVADQVGVPTWANGLALAIWNMVGRKLSGVQHWTDYGVASWYDFAVAISEEGKSAGLLDNSCKLYPVTTDQYPCKAVRPHYSVLDVSATVSKLDLKPVYWRESLHRMIPDLKEIS